MNPYLPPFQTMERIMRSADGRPLTASQQADYQTAAAEWFGHARATVGVGLDHLQAFQAATDPAVSFKAAESWMGLSQGRVIRETSPGIDAGPGTIRMLAPSERLADLVSGPGMAAGAFVKGIVTGDWRGVDPQAKAMSVGGSGGYLVPDILSARVIDRARDRAAVVRAGALTVPMESNTLTMARVAGDPTAEWHEENAAITASDASLEAVTLRSRTLTAIVKVSVELFEDAANVDRVIENSLGQALALELDRAALRGTGAAGEPVGLANQPGVTTTPTVGSPASYVAFADTPTLALRQANAAEPYALISNPRLLNSLDKLVTGIDGDLTRLAPPPAWTAMRRFHTNQVPVDLGAGSNESQAYIGDFGQMVIGVRTELTIEASRDASDGGSSAFGNLQVWLRAYLRADVALLQPSHFVVLDGILA